MLIMQEKVKKMERKTNMFNTFVENFDLKKKKNEFVILSITISKKEKAL